jgi:hypothetical protein
MSRGLKCTAGREKGEMLAHGWDKETGDRDERDGMGELVIVYGVRPGDTRRLVGSKAQRSESEG